MTTSGSIDVAHGEVRQVDATTGDAVAGMRAVYAGQDLDLAPRVIGGAPKTYSCHSRASCARYVGTR